MLEAERGELLDDGFAQLRNELAALRGEFLAGAEDFGVELGQRGVQAVQFLVALFEALVAQDPPAAVLASRCRSFLESPPPDDWDGTYAATGK